MSNLKTMKVILAGRVQGVGFRFFAEDRAQSFGVKGYVRNTIDNKVEIVCQGTENKLELFIMEMKKGPTFAHVREVNIQEIPDSQPFDSFDVRF